MKNNDNNLHVYIINSGFQLVSSVLLANERKNNLFICFEHSYYDSIKAQNKNWSVYELKFHRLKGLLGRRRGAYIYLKKFFAILSQHRTEQIAFYMPVIAGSQYNYIIRKSEELYSKDNVTINIIPDGTANMIIEPFSSERKKNRVAKKDKCLIDKLFNLKYTPYYNDQHGIVSDAVHTIYTIPGMPHEYPKDKTTDLPVIKPKNKNRYNTTKRALILGQWMVNHELLNQEEECLIKKKISEILRASNVTDINYIPHPVAKAKGLQYELLPENAKIIDTTKPVELYMLEEQFDIVIAVMSTALITCKLMLGDKYRCISIGSEFIRESVAGLIPEIIKTYKDLDIEVLNIKTT